MEISEQFKAANAEIVHVSEAKDGSVLVARQQNHSGIVIAFGFRRATGKVDWFAREPVARTSYKQPAPIKSRGKELREHGAAWTNWAKCEDAIAAYLEAQSRTESAITPAQIAEFRKIASAAN